MPRFGMQQPGTYSHFRSSAVLYLLVLSSTCTTVYGQENRKTIRNEQQLAVPAAQPPLAALLDDDLDDIELEADTKAAAIAPATEMSIEMPPSSENEEDLIVANDPQKKVSPPSSMREPADNRRLGCPEQELLFVQSNERRKIDCDICSCIDVPGDLPCIMVADNICLDGRPSRSSPGCQTVWRGFVSNNPSEIILASLVIRNRCPALDDQAVDVCSCLDDLGSDSCKAAWLQLCGSNPLMCANRISSLHTGNFQAEQRFLDFVQDMCYGDSAVIASVVLSGISVDSFLQSLQDQFRIGVAELLQVGDDAVIIVKYEDVQAMSLRSQVQQQSGLNVTFAVHSDDPGKIRQLLTDVEGKGLLENVIQSDNGLPPPSESVQLNVESGEGDQSKVDDDPIDKSTGNDFTWWKILLVVFGGFVMLSITLTASLSSALRNGKARQPPLPDTTKKKDRPAPRNQSVDSPHRIRSDSSDWDEVRESNKEQEQRPSQKPLLNTQASGAQESMHSTMSRPTELITGDCSTSDDENTHSEDRRAVGEQKIDIEPPQLSSLSVSAPGEPQTPQLSTQTKPAVFDTKDSNVSSSEAASSLKVQYVKEPSMKVFEESVLISGSTNERENYPFMLNGSCERYPNQYLNCLYSTSGSQGNEVAAVEGYVVPDQFTAEFYSL